MSTEHKKLESAPVHYYTCGRKGAPCIVFLHAAFANHSMFDPQLGAFAGRYRVLTIDLLGHGLSQGEATKDRIDASARHIERVLDAEGVDRAHLVGVSMGALLAQDFANKYPGRVLSLSALGGYDINRYDKSMAKQQRGQQLAFMVQAIFSPRRFCRSSASISAETQPAREALYAMNRSFRRGSFKYMAALGNIMNRHPATGRAYPLLIACGEKDAPLALELAEKWHRDEPESMLCILPEAGHCANMDDPRAFNRMLESFLAGSAAAEKSAV